MHRYMGKTTGKQYRNIRVVFPDPVSPRTIVTLFDAILRISDSRPWGRGNKSYDCWHLNERDAPRAIGSCSLCSRRDEKIFAFPLEAESVSLSILVEWVLVYFWRLKSEVAWL